MCTLCPRNLFLGFDYSLFSNSSLSSVKSNTCWGQELRHTPSDIISMLLKTLLALCLLMSACKTLPTVGLSTPPAKPSYLPPAKKPSYLPPAEKPSYLPSCVDLVGESQPTLLDKLLSFFNMKKAISLKCQNIIKKVPELQKIEKKVPSSFKQNYDVHWETNKV